MTHGEKLVQGTRHFTYEQIKAWQQELTGADVGAFIAAGGLDVERRSSADSLIQTTENESAFEVRPMADVVRDGAAMPTIPQIAGPLLFAGDLGFLFGKANAGKTPLAFLIAEQFCSGKTILGPMLDTSGKLTPFRRCKVTV